MQMNYKFGPDNPDQTFVRHSYPEQIIDLGEIRMNYAVAGIEGAPALLLVPAQTESWWGYEEAMKLLEPYYRTFAVDLRGQGRSSRTPGRYTLDNIGNDLVRFINLAIGRPTIVAGLSSGGVFAAWLGAFAPPGTVRAVYCEDAPLFSSEIAPAYGDSMRHNDFASVMDLFSKYLGDQWSIGAWDAMVKVAPSVVPDWMVAMLSPEGPPQNLKEYDPEWARAFRSGSASAACDHLTMLKSIKVPVLFSHHWRKMDESGAASHGAISDYQAKCVGEIVRGAGQPFDYVSFPEMGHFMHSTDPQLYVSTLRSWADALPPPEA
jgi:pimeloyl-ACP methyl ester carboxylesterase